MTKDTNSKSKMLGRLIFGEKRKQRTATSRHRSSTRNNGKGTETKPSHAATSSNGATNKEHINIHDWAVWRMHLNEQMGVGMADQVDLQQIRQFLQSNPFYQQHSRDPSNGRYNGVRLLFSIPHAKLQPELNDTARVGSNKITHLDVPEITAHDQHHLHHKIDDRLTTNINPVPTGLPPAVDKKITQFLPRNLIHNTDGFLHVNEQIIASDATRPRHLIRTSFASADRIHSTLQKAVKDGNVLEKIKAFEMQAAAVQAELTPKLNRGIHNNHRTQIIASPIQSRVHRALSPVVARPIQHPISPQPMQYEPQQQQQQHYVRSHRSRHVHPAQRRRDDHVDPMTGHVSRKGAHVLEPAHGDVILKRRTPSQKAANDDDYSMTVMSSMALTTSQGHHQHRPHHHHQSRASASRSRHRGDPLYEKRSASNHEHAHKKQTHKQKGTTTPSSSSNKTNTRYRWLIGRKENSNDTSKQDSSKGKSNKTDQTKKKTNEKEKEKRESSKKVASPDSKGKRASTPDQNRVYDVPKPIPDEQIKSEPISPQPPSRIDEENESDREEKPVENPTDDVPVKDENENEKAIPNQEAEPTIVVERRVIKAKTHQTLPSIDGEIQSKVEDETRFSRPTDDHAHRSELIDEDDECKSEGDVFLEESSVTNIVQSPANSPPAEGITYDRRWQWSKESGGLIEKSIPKKKVLSATTTPREQTNQISASETIPKDGNQFEKNEHKTESNSSKQILHTLLHSKKITDEQAASDEFFENGPHTNPEESFATSA